MASKFRVAAWVVVGAITGIMATLQVQALARNTVSPLPLEELQQFAAVYGLIKADFFEPVEGKKLIENAINGMVNNLDPHSEYLDKKNFKDFKESTSGKFVGVGIEIAAEDGLVKVVSPIEGSPAARAGIHAGDLITRIDNTAVKGLSLGEAVKLMRGKPGTKVTLTVLRKSENRTLTFDITRELIQVHSVRGKIVAPGYAWIRITQFQQDTLSNFVQKLDELVGRAVPTVTDWKFLNLNHVSKAVIDQDKCISCGRCHVVCEDTSHQAITAMKDGVRHFEVKEEECVGCNLCVSVCPVDECITLRHLVPGEVDLRTGEPVPAEPRNWLAHPNNPMATA